MGRGNTCCFKGKRREVLWSARTGCTSSVYMLVTLPPCSHTFFTPLPHNLPTSPPPGHLAAAAQQGLPHRAGTVEPLLLAARKCTAAMGSHTSGRRHRCSRDSDPAQGHLQGLPQVRAGAWGKGLGRLSWVWDLHVAGVSHFKAAALVLQSLDCSLGPVPSLRSCQALSHIRTVHSFNICRYCWRMQRIGASCSVPAPMSCFYSNSCCSRSCRVQVLPAPAEALLP